MWKETDAELLFAGESCVTADGDKLLNIHYRCVMHDLMVSDMRIIWLCKRTLCRACVLVSHMCSACINSSNDDDLEYGCGIMGLRLVV